MKTMHRHRMLMRLIWRRLGSPRDFENRGVGVVMAAGVTALIWDSLGRTGVWFGRINVYSAVFALPETCFQHCALL